MYKNIDAYKTLELEYAQKKSRFFQEIKGLLSQDEARYWDQELLKQAEINCGFPSGYYFVLFSDNLLDIVTEFEQWCDKIMLEYLMNAAPPQKIREKIAKAIIYRLMGEKDQRPGYKRLCLQTASYLALPTNAFYSTQIAWQTCDTIWKYAGDQSIDFNYYSKRGLLLSVYMSSILFFIADTSEDYIETEKFIKTSLANIVNIAKFKPVLKLPELEDLPIIRLFT